jgi:hypothetical protein
MKLKTFLLGSAGALAVAGGAQAADLSVAEPVEYVKVCDAFGSGYWYIPGTNTCLRIGGYVRFDVNFHTSMDVFGATGSGAYGTVAHSAAWDFVTTGAVDVYAKSVTEYGNLEGVLNLRVVSDNAHATNSADVNDIGTGLFGTSLVYLGDNAYLVFGPLLAGKTTSTYEYGGSLANYGGGAYDADKKTDQVRLTWAMSGFGVMLGIEDPRDRWGSSLSSTYSLPDIIAALTMSQGHWDGKLSVGFAETTSGSGFGIQAGVTIKLNEIAKGDALRLKAAWAQGQVGGFAGGSVNTNGSTVWSALASFQHFWSSQLYSSIAYSYVSQTAGASWDLAANLVWAPSSEFNAGIEAVYTSPAAGGAAWTARVRLQRNW